MLARLPRPVALLLILAFAITALWRAATPPGQIRKAAPGHYNDMTLYRDIAEKMRQGQGYYAAAAETQRAHNYPTRPFVTVREPTLYWLGANIGWSRLNWLAYLLLGANIMVWGLALPAQITLLERLGAMAGIWFGGLAAVSVRLAPMSETWCGLLMSLALACTVGWRRRWWIPVLFIGLALSVRELALPFLLLASAFAGWERRWSELAAWGALAICFGLGMYLHAQQVAQVALPSDLASSGWGGLLGLRGMLLALVHTSWLHNLPKPLALVLAMLPALGWLSLDGRHGLFAVLLLGGYSLMLALFARPDNFYWGFLLLPAGFAGWALLPRAFGQLAFAMRHNTKMPWPAFTGRPD